MTEREGSGNLQISDLFVTFFGEVLAVRIILTTILISVFSISATAQVSHSSGRKPSMQEDFVRGKGDARTLIETNDCLVRVRDLNSGKVVKSHLLDVKMLDDKDNSIVLTQDMVSTGVSVLGGCSMYDDVTFAVRNLRDGKADFSFRVKEKYPSDATGSRDSDNPVINKNSLDVMIGTGATASVGCSRTSLGEATTTACGKTVSRSYELLCASRN